MGKGNEARKYRFILRTGALILVAVVAACGMDIPSETTAQRSPVQSGESADHASLRAATITAIQANATAEYHVMQAEGRLQARNPSQRFISDFTAAGVHLRSERENQAWSMSLAASRYGCAGDLRPLSGSAPDGAANRVEFQHTQGAGAPLAEWYVNGPLGLEQGFTLPAAPSCESGRDGELQIELSLGGDLSAEMTDEGRAVALRDSSGTQVLRYGDLFVHDAGGHVLPAHLGLSQEKLTIDIDASGATYPILVDPLVGVLLPKLLASDGTLNDNFGGSVAISGDTAIVGASVDDDLGALAGSAYVFVRSGGAWIQQQKLTASDAAAGDRFGLSVAISGDTAVIGAPLADPLGADGAGAAYVFVRNGSSWVQQEKFIASGDIAFDLFGFSVAISGDTVIVGAPVNTTQDVDLGAAYVFTRSGSIWSLQQRLTASDGAVGDEFGASVAIEGNTAIIGAPSDDHSPLIMGAGSAYAFARSGSTWTQQKKLTATDADLGDQFGHSVAISADTVVIGAHRDNDGANIDTGSVYVYIQGGTWPLQQKLTASDAAPDDEFGTSVALWGDTLVVGAASDDHGPLTDSGSAYLFVRSNDTWVEQPQKLTADFEDAFDRFGFSVAIEGNMVLVGARGDDDIDDNAGAVYAFELKKTNGDPCSVDADCLSNHCVDGVCCNAACGGSDTTDCQACSIAAGAASDGTCTLVAASTICRASTGDCDAAETCDGISTQCPADTLATAGTVCRAALSSCDITETCDGLSTQCPTDEFALSGTSCNDGNACTVNDRCDAGICTGKLKPNCP